jgi:hypothetical protein
MTIEGLVNALYAIKDDIEDAGGYFNVEMKVRDDHVDIVISKQIRVKLEDVRAA